MYSCILVTESISDALKTALNDVTLNFKSSESTDSYVEAKPHVYTWTYDDVSNNMPINTPSVLVQMISMENDTIDYIVHVCVCNPALQDKEITNVIEGETDVYKYNDGDNIDSSGVRSDLYKSCVMLAECVFNALGRMNNSNFSLSEVHLDTPSPYLDNFPFCECSVSFTASKANTETKINTKLWEYL